VAIDPLPQGAVAVAQQGEDSTAGDPIKAIGVHPTVEGHLNRARQRIGAQIVDGIRVRAVDGVSDEHGGGALRLREL
jgi:hypothetical protein